MVGNVLYVPGTIVNNINNVYAKDIVVFFFKTKIKLRMRPG